VSATGRCECAGVQYTVDGPLRDVYNCHCGRCRRITGHYMAATAAQADHVTFISDATLKWYAPDETVQYGFCGNCGSTLFWRAMNNPNHLCVAAGTLDQPTGLTTGRAWWVAEHADYHERQPGLIDFQYEG
jgi:hypothetical protein